MCWQKLITKNKAQEIEHNNFIRIILYTIRYDKENKTDVCNKSKFKKIIDKKLIVQLDEEKYKFVLDLQKFNNNCYGINCFLSKYNYFLRVFKLKKKIDIWQWKIQKNKILSDKFQAALPKNIMVFKQY